jgi:hypothetical protein
MTYHVVDVAWAAGLYEGEGTCHSGYGTYRYKGELRSRKTPTYQLRIAMTDLEPLQKFQETFGVGVINGPYMSAKSTKPAWHYSVTGYERTQAIIAAIWPWLSPRRKDQALKCLTIGR